MLNSFSYKSQDLGLKGRPSFLDIPIANEVGLDEEHTKELFLVMI
jgi:hypothetical protein